jgi:hypothetical protein
LHIDGQGVATTDDRDDHGFSPWNATPVNIGSATPGVLEVAHDRDYFKFTIATAGKYFMYTRGPTATQATLYGSDYSRQTSFSASSGSGESNNFRMEVSLSPGTYYLEVMGYSIYGIGSYTMHIDGQGTATTDDRDDHGFSPWNATPVNVGSTTSGVLEVAHDRDYFKFTIATAGKYFIYTRGPTATQATLYGSDYSSQTSFSASSGSGESNNFRMEVSLSPGTYYLEVMGYSIYGIGSYTMHIDGQGAATTDDRDDHGFSPWNASPVNVGSTTPGLLEVTHDRDYFKFTITATGKYVIYTRGPTATQATIYGSDYSSQTSFSASSGSGESSNFRMEVSLSPGTYYLEVTGYSIFGVGSYTLYIDGPVLTGLSINGPAYLFANSTATYAVIAGWNDGTKTSVTPMWSVSPTTYASIDVDGLLKVTAPTSDQTLTVTATYDAYGVTKSISKQVNISVDTPTTGDPLDNWRWRNPLPTGNTFNSVAFGGGQFAAVGQYGAIFTSTDGVSWRDRASGTRNTLYNITWGNSQFVAVGSLGTIRTSPDGVIWISRVSGTTKILTKIIWANNMYVAVGWSGTIITSPDCVTWTPRTSGVTNHLTGVSWNNGKYVVVGTAGIILSSTDAITWTIKVSGTTNTLYSVTSANNQFVTVGASGTILTSSDASIWTFKDSKTTTNLNNVSFEGNHFVAVGNEGAVIESTDGTTWITRTTITFDDLKGIAFGNNHYIAVGLSGTILLSTNRVIWSLSTAGIRNQFFDISWGNNQYVAVGAFGIIRTSPDGKSWTDRVSGTTSTLSGITWWNGKYVVVGANGTILTSVDGIAWTARLSGTTSQLRNVIWGNGVFVAVGDGGVTLTSTSGLVWTSVPSGSSTQLKSTIWKNTRYTTVSFSGEIFDSNIGSVSSGTVNPLWDIAWGNGLYVAVGDKGTILTSTDGIAWTTRTSGTTNFLYRIKWINDKFVAVLLLDDRRPVQIAGQVATDFNNRTIFELL